MADNKNPGYIEQLKEMRALRTQQLRGMNADQRFYANMNSNQRALLLANQKLAASFDSMSKTFVSGIKGLTNAVGGLAAKGASTAGNVAGGAASIAGSITSGIGKVLPFAIAGLIGKMLVWDNLTSENKNRLTSSVARLFTNVFGDLPDMFKGIIQRIVKSVSDMDIKFPIVTTLMQKTSAFIDMFSAGINILKLKFEDMVEFFKGIKDPMKLFESGMKAIGFGTLARLLLPATISLLTSIIGNRLLMGQIGDLLDSRMGGGFGGGGIRGGSRGRPSGPRGAPIPPGLVSRAVGLAKGVGRGIGRLLILVPIVGEALAIGASVYYAYDLIKGLFPDATDEEINEVIQKAQEANSSGSLEYTGQIKPNSEYVAKIEKVRKDLASAKESDFKDMAFNPGDPQSEAAAAMHNERANDLRFLKKEVEEYDKSQSALDQQTKLESGEKNPAFVVKRFNYYVEGLTDDERQFAMDSMFPIIQTANFVYYLGKDGKMTRLPVAEYVKVKKDLSKMIPVGNKEEILKQTADLIKKHEAGKDPYNAVYGKGTYGNSPKKLTEMTGQEVLDYQDELIKKTAKDVQSGRLSGTSAVGAYQFTKKFATGPYYEKHPEELGLPFNEEQQDKIYRFFINQAVDNLIATGDTDAFKKEVMGKWEIFKKGTESGKAAYNELTAMFNSPAFAQASMSSNEDPKTKEQRAAQLKIEYARMEDARKRLMAPGGDYTLITSHGEDVVKKGADKAAETAIKVKDWFTEIMQTPIEERAARFFGLGGDQSTEIQMDPGKKLGNYINYYNNDNRVSVASASGGGGGSGPSMTTNSVTNKPYFSYYQFMAGGNPAS